MYYTRCSQHYSTMHDIGDATHIHDIYHTLPDKPRMHITRDRHMSRQVVSFMLNISALISLHCTQALNLPKTAFFETCRITSRHHTQRTPQVQELLQFLRSMLYPPRFDSCVLCVLRCDPPPLQEKTIH